MSDHILAEPAIYVYYGNNLQEGTSATFTGFWNTFDRFRQFIELNDCRVITSSELVASITRLFPYRLVEPNIRAGRYVIHEAASQVILFLDRYAVQPLRDYEGNEELVTIDPRLTGASSLYSDGSLWLGWNDVIARTALFVSARGDGETGLFATGCTMSCVLNDVTELSVHIHGASILRLLIRQVKNREWPAGSIDPEVFSQMQERRGPGAATAVFEDTGHQPATVLKKILTRVAREAASLVVSVNSTYHNRFVGESCKLEGGAKPNELQFRISNGEETLRGVFHTVARDVIEQKVALAYVSRIYQSYCRSADFRLG